MVKKRPVTGSLPEETARTFVTQFKQTSKIPASVQRAVFNLAVKAGHIDLITALVSRRDTPEDLLVKYSTLNDISVRVAFLTRSGHDAEFLRQQISGEKRAGVLKALVSDSTTEDILEVVSKVFCDRPTRALAESLLQVHSKLDKVTQLKVLEVLMPKLDSLTSVNLSAVNSLVEDLASVDSAVSEVAMLVASTSLVDPFFSKAGLTADARLALVNVALRRRVEENKRLLSPEGKRTNWHVQKEGSEITNRIIVLLSVEDLQDEVLVAIENLVEDTFFLDFERENIISRINAQTKGVVLTEKMMDALQDLASKGDDAAQNRIVTSDDFSIEERLRVLKKMRNHYSVIPFAAKLPDVLVQELYQQDPISMAKEHGFDLLPGGVEGEIELVRHAAIESEKSTNHYSYRYSSPLSILVRTGKLSQVALKSFPWKYVNELASGYIYTDSSNSTLLAALTQLQEEAFGESTLRWETYAVLAADYAGTVAELIDMVVMLTPED